MKVIEDAYKEDDDLVIAVGSSQKKDELDNPFSGAERRQMLESALSAEGISARLVLIPDIICDNTYVHHVEKHIKGKPDSIITENDWTIKLFRKAGYKVKVTPRHFGISSTEIRKRIAAGNEWKTLIPEEVAEIIENVNGVERIKKLFSSSAS